MTEPAKILDFESGGWPVREGYIETQIALNPDSDLACAVAHAAAVAEPVLSLVVDHVPTPPRDIVTPLAVFDSLIRQVDALKAQLVELRRG